MEEIDSMWKRLSLNEIEGERFNLGSSTQVASHSLAAKFFTRRVINVEAVTRTFKLLWRTERGFSARDMGDNILLFEFEDEADMERVLFSEPWSYDKYLMAFNKVVEDVEIGNVVFDKVAFWVQIHNLPILSLKKEVARALCCGIGEVMNTTETEEELGGGRVMRLRVRIDITKPLCRGRKIGLANGKEGWAAFKYERLPNFCYWCGLVTHSEKDCGVWLRNRNSLGKKDQGYGAWMKAEVDRANRKVEVHVAGRATQFGREAKNPPEEGLQQPGPQAAMSEDSRGLNMEISAPNPGSDMQSTQADFEGQLREIDKELGLFDENPGITKLKVSMSTSRNTLGASLTPRRHNPKDKGPLTDITNIPKTGVGSWKKKARAYGMGIEGPVVVLAEKRGSEAINEAYAWRLTFVYGAPETHLRIETWNLIRRLSQQSHIPWCCIGDFNEIALSSEMQGRRPRPEKQMKDFRERPAKYHLGSAGSWCGNIGLDTKFHGAQLEHLNVTNSDHKCLHLELEPCNQPHQVRRSFRFEEIWTSDVGCEATIQNEWDKHRSGTAMFQVWNKLKDCKRGLGRWSRQHFGNVTRQLAEKRQQLMVAETNAIQGGSMDRVKLSKSEINFLLDKEERMWRQRSRTSWLKNGDRNTRYFHGHASQRRRRNRIMGLRNNEGVWVEAKEEVVSTLVGYYENIFTSSQPTHIEEAVTHVPQVITTSINENLTRTYTAIEVDEALKQMAPLKAPGPDGLPPLFYQKYWPVVGQDVTRGVLSCLNSGQLLTSINHTFITLIPKVKNPERVTEFRPISLCNVIYKLVSKVIANRLKTILPHIISDSQSAFVPGRLITDNVLVAFETLHHMHITKMGREGAMALKLDMSKAYDRVEWIYLESIMRKMGFHPRWVSMIMQCISTVSYSLLINGEPHGFLKPSRGLRQGDPLSPYLFLLCAEGLHSLISRASEQGELQGVALCRRGPRITHLFFADDSLLFTKATTRDCAKLQEILLRYERASGQQVNRDKTAIFFSKDTPMGIQEAIKATLGVPIIKQYERYLGLPSFVGKNRTACFTQLKERVWSKLMGWKEKLLSQAGREVLIKYVAQAIPTYTMSCFRLPNRLCQDLESMIRKFWWGHGPDKNKICWVKWSSLCYQKDSGGMGFRELRKFNDAMLGKQVWRLLTDTNSLLYRVFKAKFFPHCSILEADPKTKGSYAWQSILKARDVIQKGVVWRVGNGKKISIWRQNWLLEDHHRRVITPAPALLADSTVAELISPQTNHWDESLIDNIFFPYDAVAIKSIPLSEGTAEDKPFWPGTKTGQYTVRSGYKFLQTEDMTTQPSCSNLQPMKQMWKEVWSLQVPKKIQMFMWRSLKDSLPSKLNLKKKHVVQDSGCDLCGALTEDILHALCFCPHASAAWGEDPGLKEIRNFNSLNFMELWCQLGKMEPPMDREVFSTTCWAIWHRRNKVRLGQQVEKAENIPAFVREYLLEFQACQFPHSPSPSSPVPTHWRKPTTCRYKVNYDGAVFAETAEAGIGVIVRNDYGKPIATLSQKIRYPLSVEATEAMAA
uniref:Reverse transcriptase domain-containing protein n=1 Tax=Fagus sylvatica TaxID=28930 RepID=A0A2N9ETE5_FAGSY